MSVNAEQVFATTHEHGIVGQVKQELFHFEDCSHGVIFYDYFAFSQAPDNFIVVMIAIDDGQSAIQYLSFSLFLNLANFFVWLVIVLYPHLSLLNYTKCRCYRHGRKCNLH